MKNKYNIDKEKVIIYIYRRNGEIFETYVDVKDFEKIKDMNLSWNTKFFRGVNNYYVVSTQYLGMINNKPKYKSLLLHRLIMDAKKGDIVDHKNHNTLDNRKSNLRITKQNQNTKNRKSKNINNTSGYRNVSKVGKWWHVQLQINGKNIILKKFPLDKLNEAGKYAELMRAKYYGKFAGN